MYFLTYTPNSQSFAPILYAAYYVQLYCSRLGLHILCHNLSIDHFLICHYMYIQDQLNFTGHNGSIDNSLGTYIVHIH